MKFRVYRSLDKPSVLFGIKGTFFFVTLLIAGIGGFFAIIVGSLTVSYVGTGVFLLSIAVAYGVTLYLQGKMTEREFKRMLACRSLPRMFIMKPKTVLTRRRDTDAGKR